MSLFKTRDLWSTSLDKDLFDLGCLKVANVGANKKQHASIITGSYNGFLRIYNPNFSTDNSSSSTSSASSSSSSNTQQASFRANDLVCELALPGPIIQIETGKFVSTSKKEHIAALLPKKLIIYEAVVFESGNVEHGNQYSLKLIYEHNLARTSYNMCKGSFGNSSNDSNEYLCVQSMDGMLSIFEYESHSVTCFLPKCLLPGPLKYVARTDSFVTVSASWHVESYKYQSLALTAKFANNTTKSGGANNQSSATTRGGGGGDNDHDNNDGGNGNHDVDHLSNSSNQKRILPDYSYNIGESAIDIQVHGTNIVVMGERNLFCFTETCALRFMKKFDYNPSALCVYGNVSADSVQFLIANHAKLLYVHQDAKVKWAAQLEHTPVQVCVARLNDLDGCIVTLCEDGNLKCSYLGTEPALLNPIVEAADSTPKPFDFEHAEAEYRRLQGHIKTAIVNTGALFKAIGGASNSNCLNVSVQVPSRLDDRPMSRDTELRDPLDAIPSITVKMSFRAAMEIAQQVKVTIMSPLPIVAVPDSFSFAQVTSISYDQEVVFYMKTKHIPSSLEVNVTASYLVGPSGGVPRVTESKFNLPLKLVAKSGQHSINPKLDQSIGRDSSSGDFSSSKASTIDSKIQSNTAKKVTIDANKPCVNLVDLFPEFSASYSSATGNVLAAQFFGHAHVNITIQAAKSGANRYRLQSDSNSYDYLSLLTREFVSRLENHSSSKSGGGSVDLSFSSDNLPTDELKLCIDRHLELRHILNSYKEAIEKCCVQFRAIQKRLLIKFKDKSPTSLDNMDALLEATYRQIVTLSDNCISTQRALSIAAHSLNCTAGLYVLLVGLAFKMSKDAAQVLEQILTSKFGDTSDLGWEEIVSTSVTNMLKVALSKSSSKDQLALQQQSQTFKLPDDSSKLDKQLRSFISKLQSGASFVSDVYRLVDESSTATSTTLSEMGEGEKQAARGGNGGNSGGANLKSQEIKTEYTSTTTPRTSTRPQYNTTEHEYDYERDEESGEKMTRKPQVKPRGTGNKTGGMSSFEEFMQSDEFKGKDSLNFESDEDD